MAKQRGQNSFLKRLQGMHKLCESTENASKYGIRKKWVNT